MNLARTRLAAGALGLAVAGTATGAVIARADDSAPAARVAQQGGVSITPALVERPPSVARRLGHRQEHHQDTMRITVNVRPWIQNRATGASCSIRAPPCRPT